jgi:hypothetical protein
MSPFNPIDRPVQQFGPVDAATGGSVAGTVAGRFTDVSRQPTFRPDHGRGRSDSGSSAVTIAAASSSPLAPRAPFAPFQSLPLDGGPSAGTSGFGFGAVKKLGGEVALAIVIALLLLTTWRALSRLSLRIPSGLSQNVLLPPG